MKFIALAIALAGSSALAEARKSNKGSQAPVPVESVDILRYAGRWMQAYDDLYTNSVSNDDSGAGSMGAAAVGFAAH